MIEKLKKLKLSDYPILELDSILSSLKPLGILITELNPNDNFPKIIERAVNNSKEEPEFDTVSRISFKPAIFNHSYLRASTPNNTMFYGSVISELLNEQEIRDSKIVGACEVATLIRGNEVREGRSDVTFGKWEVSEKIYLATIINPTKDYEEEYLNKLKFKYIKYLETLPTDVKVKTIECLNFITEEFEKRVPQGCNHEYLISSKFTEIFLDSSFCDGVIYPSVQSSQYGLCVALHPRSVHKLNLVKVSQSRLTKTVNNQNENEFMIIEEKNCNVEPNATKFKLQNIKNIA